MNFRSQLPLTRKLTLTMMATSSAALLVACIFFLSYDRITLRHNMVDHLHSLAGITGANVTAALTYNDPKSADLVLQVLQAEPHIVAARIYDNQGRAFASYQRFSSAPRAQLPRLSPSISSRFDQDQVTECDAILFDGESLGYVYLVSDLQEIQVRMRRFVVFVLILMAASSAAAFVVAVLLKHFISKPILDLVDTTRTISREKNFGVRAPKYAEDEVGLLVDGFNEMLGEIESAEAALRAAHAESELFINSVPSILIGTDNAGKITRWNLAATNVFGFSAGAVLGQPLWQCGIHWQEAQLLGKVDAWFRLESSEKRQNVTFERDGQRRFLGLTIINVALIPGGEGTGFLITGADITEQKVLEAQLRQAQKLEAIGQLAAGIAHEINTPAQFVGDNAKFLQDTWPIVNKILGLCLRLREQSLAGSITPDLIAELVECTEEADPTYLLREVPQAIVQALEGVGRVSKIVKAMKEFSHPGSEGKCAIDLNHAIETTIAVARNEWKYVADVETCFADNLPPVPCLAGEFNQVMLNLLMNAAQTIGDVVKKGSAKGTITITTKCDGDWVEVQIKDTGAGIPENVRGRIFEPFFTTKEVGKGTGQGLALAHAVMVKKHDGKIWFESEEGRGTTFFLRLPLTVTEPGYVPNQQQTSNPATSQPVTR
jgi:PAS domain S-box-containing protein